MPKNIDFIMKELPGLSLRRTDGSSVNHIIQNGFALCRFQDKNYDTRFRVWHKPQPKLKTCKTCIGALRSYYKYYVNAFPND